ncbi:MAG: hypothetical protein PHV62_08010 [Sulfuricurvum sp.]|nr:hypothetical protein [Sulfuricurvum sp.]
MKIIKPNTYTYVTGNVADTTYAAWNIATVYAANDYVSVSTNHGEYQAVSGNTGKDPRLAINLYDATKNPTGCWTFLGTTNRWKMFDQYLNTQTVNPLSITATLTCYDAQAIFIGNIDADSVQIQIKENFGGTIIEDVTYSMIPDPIDWMAYLYGSWLDERKRNIIYERTTLTRDVTIIVTATATTAKIGSFFAGYSNIIGATLWQFRASALDYSTVATDTQSGATFLQQGNYAKLLDATLFINTSISDEIYSMLVSLRGIPIVFYDNPETTLVYGFIKTFDMNISGPVETKIDLKLQGLI